MREAGRDDCYTPVMRAACVVMVVLLLSGCGTISRSPIAVLQHADSIESAATGVAGAESHSVRAYRQILSRPGSSRYFARIFRDATPAGKVYALAGLYETDRRAFDQLVQTDFLGSSTKLMFLQGCVGDTIPESEVREKLMTGYFSRIWRR